MIKLIAFDLDGTLTQHKTPLDEKNKAVLDRLAELAAGICPGVPIHIFRQSRVEIR